MLGYKILTHDYRSPIQGGLPLWDGHTLPVDLPRVECDAGPDECAAGWNFVADEDLAHGFALVGLWPTGRPSIVLRVEAGPDAICRGRKCRSARLRLIEPATDAVIDAAIDQLCAPFPHGAAIAEETRRWRAALARPAYDPRRVEMALGEALAARGLSWSLRRFADSRDAWAARAAWAAGGDAWAARAAWDAWAAGAAGAAWAARDAGAAWDAGAGLVVFAARSTGWVAGDPLLLTTGLRDAYAAGLELALPTRPGELGWTMSTAHEVHHGPVSNLHCKA